MAASTSSERTSRLTRLLVEQGVLLAVVAFVVYLLLAPTTIVDGDNAEFSTVGALGGRAHPSGYPAYVLYLRLLSWLPGSTPAHTAALATCLLAALLVLVLHAACRAWGARPLAATFATAIYAASPVVLRMHTEAEVFAGNGLVVATVLWLSAARGPLRGMRRNVALGLVAGLGLANHLTCALIAPVGCLGAIRGVREETGSRRALAIAGAIGALAVGLATYLYLYVADSPVSYGKVDDVHDLIAFFLRSDYGGPGAFVPTGVEVSAWDNLAAFVATLGRAWLYGPAIAGVAYLGYLVAKPRGETRWAWALLAASWLVAGPLLVLRFNIPPKGLGIYVAQRFHLLPVLLLAIPIAAAFDRVGDARVKLDQLRSPKVATGLALVGFLAMVAVALPRLRAVHSPAMERGFVHMIRSLPEHALVIADSEDICFGLEYLQQARGERPDIDVVCWILTSRGWYRQRMRARGLVFTKQFSLEPTLEQAQLFLDTKRPLFVDRSQKQLLASFPSYPYGLLVRLLPKGAPAPTLPEVVELNRAIYAAFDLDYPRPGPDDDYATIAHKRYAATWVTLAEALRAAGDEQGAQDAIAVARQLYPSAE
ncbi:MAG TPA: DUF2723 domain-containing protein [Kofleriaceae bacterium]|nr:DUF2723 domain-containing protein [Kofleriaceae bacterium]